MRPLSAEDLRRLERERGEADRRYNEALTLLDASLAASAAEPELPARPAPLDESSISAVNERWRVSAEPPSASGLRGRIARLVWRIVGPAFDRQEHFNAAVVEHLNRNLEGERAARQAVGATMAALREHVSAMVAFQSRLVQYLQQVTPYVDTKDRLVAGQALRDPHEQARALEATIGLLQQQVAVLKRESARGPREDSESSSATARAGGGAPRALNNDVDGSRDRETRLNAYKYVGFEQEFRGAPEEIRRRLAAYVPYFEGASDVLDVGCGRGEFLELLRERGVSGTGLELNHEMAEVCRARGLDVVEGDAVTYLERLPDGALGGLFAGQVVEHLQADYLLRFLELAYDKLRPGSKIVLETINVDNWSAFFGPYLRDITHVRPLPSDTLMFLLRASGFQRVDMRASSPMGDEARLARISPQAAAAVSPDASVLIEAFNQNVDRLNGILFGFVDYAAIGERL
jgi:SAM-dependent methyltransferase